MKLRNKKTGEIGDIAQTSADCIIVYYPIVDGVATNPQKRAIYNSLDELNDEWEDYEEPLIKDEKIRKAIKVWAVANGFDRVFICRSFEVWGVRYDVGRGTTDSADILFRGEPPLEPGEQYSIEELCGGEE